MLYMIQGAVFLIAVEIDRQEAKRRNCAEQCKGTQDMVVSSFNACLLTPRNQFEECVRHVLHDRKKKGCLCWQAGQGYKKLWLRK